MRLSLRFVRPLFLPAKEHLPLPCYRDGIVMLAVLAVLASATLVRVGRFRWTSAHRSPTGGDPEFT